MDYYSEAFFVHFVILEVSKYFVRSFLFFYNNIYMMKTILQKLISIILDHPRWIIALTAFITVVMISFATQLKMNFSIEELFAINDPNVEKYFDFLEEFCKILPILLQ